MIKMDSEMSRSSTKQPTPLELDSFIPWMFTELQSEQMVVVKRVNQGERPSKSADRKNQSQISIMSKRTVVSLIADSTTTGSVENTIQLKTLHNRAGRVVEIAINNCPFPINRKLIETISLCLPFHPLLNKFTCKGRGLNYKVIDEIAKLLPFSSLTDICLDNSFVPQGNYYILLDQTSTLNCLSLSNCRINDAIFKKIAERLEFGNPASNSLRALCLSFNFITDIGAQALGHSLRTNRHILHLNICGNNITSVGVGHLLEPLSEFSLTRNEIRAKIRRMRDYYTRKDKTAEPEQESPQSSVNLSNKIKNNQGKKSSLKKKSVRESINEVNCTELNEKMMQTYVFGPSNTAYKNGRWFAAGNLVLCSLNLGYNCLDYTSLPKIVGTLSYQKDQDRGPGRTGLLRIVIKGNNLPLNCEEYSAIEMYLDILQNGALPLRKNKRVSSTSRKLRHNSTVHLMTPRTPRSDVGDRSSV